jgi:ABC-type multidrug transport system ATPase subunit
MQKGKMVAVGTPLHLKEKYGNGYRLTLNSVAPPQSIKPPVNSAVFESSAAGQLIWRIEDASDLSRAVQWADEKERAGEDMDIENRAEGEITDDMRVQGWELTTPTLEDVLLERKLF